MALLSGSALAAAAGYPASRAGLRGRLGKHGTELAGGRCVLLSRFS